MGTHKIAPFPLRLPDNVRAEAKEIAQAKRWSLNTLIVDVIERFIAENKSDKREATQ